MFKINIKKRPMTAFEEACLRFGIIPHETQPAIEYRKTVLSDKPYTIYSHNWEELTLRSSFGNAFTDYGDEQYVVTDYKECGYGNVIFKVSSIGALGSRDQYGYALLFNESDRKA